MSKRGTIAHRCAKCGSEWMSPSAVSTCGYCAGADLFAQLPPDVIAETDKLIYGSRILNAIKTYKEAINVGLHEARDLYEWRVCYLRKHFPERFEEQSHPE